jgi:hypothetical protein
MNFYKLWEAIDHSRNEPVFNSDRISVSELENLTCKQAVQFALYCAEDVFHLNNDETRQPAKNCIDLVKYWLKADYLVTPRELDDAYDVASHYGGADDAPSFAIAAAEHACLFTLSATFGSIRCKRDLRYASEVASFAADAHRNNVYDTADTVHGPTSAKARDFHIAAEYAYSAAISKYHVFLHTLKNNHKSYVKNEDPLEKSFLFKIEKNLRSNEPIDTLIWHQYFDWLEQNGDKEGLITRNENNYTLNIDSDKKIHFINEERMFSYINEIRSNLANYIQILINNKKV